MMLSWDDVLEVELIDTNGATDIVIADDLVSRGLAQYNTSKPAKRGIILLCTYSQAIQSTHIFLCPYFPDHLSILMFILQMVKFHTRVKLSQIQDHPMC